MLISTQLLLPLYKQSGHLLNEEFNIVCEWLKLTKVCTTNKSILALTNLGLSNKWLYLRLENNRLREPVRKGVPVAKYVSLFDAKIEVIHQVTFQIDSSNCHSWQHNTQTERTACASLDDPPHVVETLEGVNARALRSRGKTRRRMWLCIYPYPYIYIYAHPSLTKFSYF